MHITLRVRSYYPPPPPPLYQIMWRCVTFIKSYLIPHMLLPNQTFLQFYWSKSSRLLLSSLKKSSSPIIRLVGKFRIIVQVKDCTSWSIYSMVNFWNYFWFSPNPKSCLGQEMSDITCTKRVYYNIYLKMVKEETRYGKSWLICESDSQSHI